MIVDIFSTHPLLTSIKVHDNFGNEMKFDVKRILPRLVRYQRLELETLIDGSEKNDLRISTNTFRWFARDLIKNPKFIFFTLKNTYRLTFKEDAALELPLHMSINEITDGIWISRNAVKCGISPTNLDESLEYDRLRNPGRYKLLVPFAKFEKSQISYEIFERTQFGIHSSQGAGLEKYVTDYDTFVDARVIHGKIAVQDNKVIQISNKRFELVRRSPGWIEVKGNKFQIFKPHASKGVVEEAIFFGSNLNWFHFIVECLTRFITIPVELVRGTPVILESSAHVNIRRICELLTSVSPIILKPGEEILVKKLIVGRESGVVDTIDAVTRKAQLLAIRNRILDLYPHPNVVPNLKIYLRRPPRLFRPLQNERSIVKMLDKHGFISIYPENEEIDNLIDTLYRAEIVVVESGAAMTNLIFAHENLKVVELNPGEGFGFWGRFLRIFDIQSSGIVGKKQIIGFKGLAIDGYRIPVREMKRKIRENTTFSRK